MTHRIAPRPSTSHTSVETVVMQPPDPAPQRSAPAKAPAPELSFNKILAAAGAAATSAVLGSLFGVAGTVLGAAIGAMASTVAASLYQRSLDRARTAVASHVTPHVTARLRGGDVEIVDPEATVVMPPPAVADDPLTVLIAPQVPGPSRRRIVGYVIATVLGFALALGAVTVVEALKGSTLVTGQAGTSVGRVLQGSPRQTVTPTPTPTPDDSDDGGSGTSKNTDNQGDNDHHRNSDSESSSATKTPSSSSSTTPAPTESPSPSTSRGGLLGGLGASSGGGDQ